MVENKKKALFIYNSKAGKSKIKTHLSDIIDVFIQADYLVTVHSTQYPHEAVEIIGRIGNDEYDLIICSGGDGTLDEVVTGMLLSGKSNPVGYIPAGSTNDFAKSLNISTNMVEAAREITNENIFQCDVGRFNEDVFVYVAAFGLFTEVSYSTDQQMKNVLGHMAYILEGIKSLSSIKSYKLHIEGENVVQDGEFIFGMISNSNSVGGLKNVTGRDVELNDGLFEVTLVKRPQNPIELNEIAAAFVTQKMDSKNITHFKTSWLKVESDEELKWTLDGEYGGAFNRVVVKNENKALSVLCGISREMIGD